jgi:hypothetical protein
MKCKLNYNEEKPLYGGFKLITGRDAPKNSDPTFSQIGHFKKEKGFTKFKWSYEPNDENTPSIIQEVSLESLKNSTFQFQIRIDQGFSEAMHQ